MREIPKYITAFPIEICGAGNLNISLGWEKNGALVLRYQDTSELDQDSGYINEAAYPNSASIDHGKHAMWLSMFTRQIPRSEDNEL